MSDPILSARTPGASTWWEPYRDAVEKLNALTTKLAAAEAELARAKLNTRKMALLAEAFVYEPRRLTEGGLVAQIQRALTDQDVDYEAPATYRAKETEE